MKSRASSKNNFKKKGRRRHVVRSSDARSGNRIVRSRTLSNRQQAQRSAAGRAHQGMDLKSVYRIFRADYKKPGILTDVIEEYYAYLKVRSLSTSDHPKRSRSALIRSARQLHWNFTSDVDLSKLMHLPQNSGATEQQISRTIHLWQRFLRWAKHQYDIDDHSLSIRARRFVGKSGYAWSEMECAKLLLELSRPAQPAIRAPTHDVGIDRKARARERARWRVRHILFPIVWVISHWAVRPNEACRLRVHDYTPETRTLRIHGSWRNRLRGFEVDARTAAILSRQLEGRHADAPLFAGLYAHGWQRGNLQRRLTPIIKQVGIPGTLYSARLHAITMLCHLLRHDLRRLMAITGFRQVSMLLLSLPNNFDERDAARAWEQVMGSFTHEPDPALPPARGNQAPQQHCSAEAARMRARAADQYLEQHSP